MHSANTTGNLVRAEVEGSKRTLDGIVFYCLGFRLWGLGLKIEQQFPNPACFVRDPIVLCERSNRAGIPGPICTSEELPSEHVKIMIA